MADGAEKRVTAPHGLAPRDLALIRGVLVKHPEITGVILFGSRAKGTAGPASDIDLALEGIGDPLQAEAVARELDELPLPYRFDVKALAAIRHRPLLEHIAGAGVRIPVTFGERFNPSGLPDAVGNESRTR